MSGFDTQAKRRERLSCKRWMFLIWFGTLDEFVPVLGRFKRELGLTVFVHTGIIKKQTGVALREAGIDAALIDVMGSEETVSKILNLKVTVQDYADSLRALQEAKLNVVPHIIVGLNEGKLDGELKHSSDDTAN